MLAFLVDVQSHGAENLQKLSADFKVLGDTASRIAKQVAEMQATLDRTAASAAAAGQKVAAGSAKAAEAVNAEAGATDRLSAAQKGQADSSKLSADASAKQAAVQKDLTAQTVASDASMARQQKTIRDTTGAIKDHTGGLTALGSRLDQSGKKMTAFASTMAPVSLGLLGIGAYSVKMGVDFQRNMTLLQTQAGASAEQVKKLEAGILAMGGKVMQTPNELAAGMYHVVSAMNDTLKPSERVSGELKIQAEAAKLAAVGHSNLEETTYALVSAMKALHEPAQNAAKVTAELNAIVGVGDMRMQDLVGALSSGIIPAATTFGISIQSVGAALDTMTKEGTPAASAATRLRMGLALLGAPTQQSAKLLGALGLSSKDVTARTQTMSEMLQKAGLRTSTLAQDLKKPNGIMVALEDLKTHMEAAGLKANEQGEFISRAFGGGRMGVSIQTLFKNLGSMQADYNAQLKITGQYGEDYKKTTETTAFKYGQLRSELEKVGIELGKELMPVADTLLHDVEAMVGWFTKLPAPIKDATLAAVALGAVISPVAYAMGGLTRFGGGLATAGGKVQKMLGPTAATATAGAAEGGALTTAMKIGAGIWGVRGAEPPPGSLMNPIAVQMLGAGAVPGGMGIQGGAVTRAEAAAAKAEGAVPGAMTGGALSTAETAAAVGAGSKALSMGRSLLGGLMKGGMIAGVGMMGSELAGTMIGGKTGSAISSIGSATAVGAALGSLIGPEGTLAGAVGGALVGGFEHFINGPAESEGQKVAKKAAKGMGTPISEALQKGIDESANPLKTMLAEAMKGKPISQTVMLAARRQAEGVQYKAGSAFGGEMVAQEMSATKGMSALASLSALISDTETRFASLPGAARAGAFASVMAMVKSYQEHGQLPPTAVEEMLKSIEGKFPALKQEFGRAGQSSVSALNAALASQSVLTSAEGLLNQWRNVFTQMPKIVGLNMSDAVETFHRANTELLALEHTGTESQRLAAKEAHVKLLEEEQHYFQELRGSVAGEIAKLSAEMHKHAPGAVAPLERAFHNVVGIINEEVAAMVITSAQGAKRINSILTKEMSALGLKAPSKLNQSFGPMPGGGGNALQETGVGGSSGFTGLAHGGRVPGSVGPDNWTLVDPSGRPAAMVGGGELLIANRHTEAEASAATMALYGKTLGQMVAGETRPHSAATGLRIRGPVSTFGPPGEAASGTAYGLSSADPGIAVNPHGGSNWNDALARSLAMKVAHVVIAGHSANLRVIDKGPSAIGSHGPRLIDVTGAGVRALGIPYGSFPTDAIGEAIFGAGGTAVGSGAFGPIKAPRWTGPGGVLGEIGRTMLSKVAEAATARLAALAPSGGGGAVTAAGGAPTGGGFSPSQLGTFDGLQVAKWIIPELLYARAHGWTGPITSGYRAGFDPMAPSGSMHALDIYPGGAVDFGGMHEAFARANRAAFIKATAGYSGERLLTPIGFVDDGHMSGTGHARGGRVAYAGSFAQGGMVTAHGPTLAMFGEGGRAETAIFLPHLQTGGALGDIEGAERAYEAEPHKGTTKAGEKITEGLNPSNNQIEWHTAAQWRRIRTLHSQYVRLHPKAGMHEDVIRAAGMTVGEIESKAAGAINLSSKKDVASLSLSAWNKVVHAIETTLKSSQPESDVRATLSIARGPQTPRMRALLSKAITDTAAVTMRAAANVPSTQATGADAHAITEIQKLVGVAHGSIQSALLKDIQKQAASWDAAIKTAFTKRQASLTGTENLKIARASLAAISAGGPGALLPTSATDPAFYAAQMASQDAEIKAMERERTALKDAERRAHAAHNKKLVEAVRAQIGEVDTALADAKVNVAQLQIDFSKAVYEAFKAHIAEAGEVFQRRVSASESGYTIAEGEREMHGLSTKDIEEVANEKTEGLLSPAQIAQVQSNWAEQKASEESQRRIDEEQRAYDESQLPGLSGADREGMISTIRGLTEKIVGLGDAIYQGERATYKLTHATEENTKAQYGGSVGFTFQGQNYIVGDGNTGQSSVSAPDISVGL